MKNGCSIPKFASDGKYQGQWKMGRGGRKREIVSRWVRLACLRFRNTDTDSCDTNSLLPMNIAQCAGLFTKVSGWRETTWQREVGDCIQGDASGDCICRR